MAEPENPSRDPSETPSRPPSDWRKLLPSLDDVGKRRRGNAKRVGHKIALLAELRRADLPVPPGWVIARQHYDAFLEKNLPQKHDLRTLIKLSKTRIGDERCARAHEELMQAELDPQLCDAVAALWQEELHAWSDGVAVRASLATASSRRGSSPQLRSKLGRNGVDAILESIRQLWADSVLASVVENHADASLPDAAVAILLQQHVDWEQRGLLTRTPGSREPIGEAEWHLGIELPRSTTGRPGDDVWRRRTQVLVALAEGRGGESLPTPLARMRDVLEPSGFEQLRVAGKAAEEAIGRDVVLHFAARQSGDVHNPRCELHVLAADESPRWTTLRGGDERTTWVEITLGSAPPDPATRLTQSIVDRVVQQAVHSTLAKWDCAPDDKRTLVGRWAARSYLNIDAVLEAVADVPLLAPEDLLNAIGGPDPSRMRSLAGRAAARRRRVLRLPSLTSAAVRQQLDIDTRGEHVLRQIERELRQQQTMDLTLLPNDAIGITLRGAQSLLERCAKAWSQFSAAQLACRVAMRILVQRRVADAPAWLGYTLTAGGSDSYIGRMVERLERVVETLRADPPEALLAGTLRNIDELPDGRARGALGQFLSRYGHLAFSAFEVHQPRWRDDPRQLFSMVAALLRAGSMGEDLVTPQMRRRARAQADAELARYEPALGPFERRTLRFLIDRTRALGKRRSDAGELTYSATALLQRVALDIDRRIQRMDREVPSGGAFHASTGRLVNALTRGHADMARVIRMREVERRSYRREAAPPLSFVASPPRGAIPVLPTNTIQGLGVSPGVVEGAVRIVRTAVPEQLNHGEILLVHRWDPLMTPLLCVAAAVIAEGGGSASPGAELARELGVPAVMSIQEAALLLRDGERVRLDGRRGTIERLESPRPPSRRGSAL